MQFVYGQWAPDAGETAPGAVMVADGVSPLVEGYGPAPGLVAASSAASLPSAPRGVISMFQRNGTNVVFAFTDTSCYQLNASFGWDLVQAGFSLTADDDWSLAQYGNYLLATNTTQGMMRYDIELGGAFVAIPEAGAPRDIFVCANYVVACDCEDDAGNRDNRLIRTSVLGNPNDFTGAGSDYQQVEDGGRLVGGIDLKNNAALIFQDNALRLMQFGGNATGAFSLLKISDGRGSVGRRSIAGLDGIAYWLSTDGFNSYTGNGIQHIGSGRIDDWFNGQVAVADMPRVRAAMDPLSKAVMWLYPALSNPSATVYQDAIRYSWEFDKWSTRQGAITYLTQIATPGITLDAMGTDYGVLDDIDILLDSRFFQGGQPVFAALDENYKYATFTGSSIEGEIRTATSNSGETGLISWITPINDCATSTLALGVKDRLDETITWKPAMPKVNGGRVPLRGRGMNVAFTEYFLAGAQWTFARGLDHLRAQTNGGPK